MIPDDQIDIITWKTDDLTSTALIISQENEPLATIFPTVDSQNNILCAASNSKYLNNQLGVTIGDTYQSIYPEGVIARCMAGNEDMTGKVICRAPNTKTIYYAFGRADGEKVVPRLTPVFLNDWALQQVIWLPDIGNLGYMGEYCHVN